MEQYMSRDGRLIKVEEITVPGMAGEPTYQLSATIDGQAITICKAIKLLPPIFSNELQQWQSELAELNYSNAVSYCI